MPARPTPALTSPGPCWPTWWPAGLLAAAAVGAYADSFSGPFVFDDVNSILNNATIHRLWPLWRVLSPPEPRWTVSGRPLLNLSLAVNYAIGGTGVWSYHALNLLIHVLAGLTLFGIVRRTMRRAAPNVNATAFGFVAALLWTVHPLQTEAVTYVIQRAESLMGLLYLLTLYGFIRGVEATGSRAWLVGSWIACLCGMGAKEVMVSAPVLVLLYDRTFVSGGFRAAWQRRRVYYLGLASSWALLAYLVGLTGNRGGSAGIGIGVSWGAYALTQFHAVVTYLGVALWPASQSFDYGALWVRDPWTVLPDAVLVLALGIGALYALWRKPQLGFLGFWFFAILAPTSLVPGNRQTIAEHRMYLALAPVTVLAAFGAMRWLGRRGMAALIAAALFLAGLTARRNEVYRSNAALWSDAVRKVPDNPFARDNLGACLANAGDLAGAGAQFAAALRLKPDDVFALTNYGVLLMQTGHPADAIGPFEAALKVNPDFAIAHALLARAFSAVGDFEDAEAQVRLARRLGRH